MPDKLVVPTIVLRNPSPTISVDDIVSAQPMTANVDGLKWKVVKYNWIQRTFDRLYTWYLRKRGRVIDDWI